MNRTLWPVALCLAAIAAVSASAEDAATVSPPAPTPLSRTQPSESLSKDATPAPSQDGGPLMTLDEAIAYALVHQPDVARAAGASESAAGQLRATRSERLPSVQVFAGQQTVQNRPSLYRGASTTVSARQLLFDMGRTTNAIAASRAQQAAAEETERDVRLLVARDVTASYFALLETEGIAQANAETVRSREEQRNAAAARLSAGTAARFDVLRAETALAQSRNDLSIAQGDVRRARARLNTAMGRPAESPVAVVEPTAFPDITAEEAMRLAVENRPDLRAARLQVEGARRSVEAARRNNAPALAATGDMSGLDRTFPATDLEWSVGMGVTWDAFDGNRTRGLVESARGSRRQAEADLRQTELTVSRDVTDAVTAVETAAEQMTLSEAALREATEARDVAVGRYQSGVGTQLEVTDAETQLLQAQVAAINARYGLAAARRDLRIITGRLPDGTAP